MRLDSPFFQEDRNSDTEFFDTKVSDRGFRQQTGVTYHTNSIIQFFNTSKTEFVMQNKRDAIIDEITKSVRLNKLTFPLLLENFAVQFPEFDKIEFINIYRDLWHSVKSKDPKGMAFIIENRKVWDELLEIYEKQTKIEFGDEKF